MYLLIPIFSKNNVTDVKYRFSGKEWDANAQLYYYGFRWYDPEHGIWTTKDPIGLAAGDLNVYRMVFNNPVYFVDIYGRDWIYPDLGSNDFKMGRPGFPIANPDNPAMNAAEKYGPGLHDFATIHDGSVDELTDGGLPDPIANIPTMPFALVASVMMNTICSITKIPDLVNDIIGGIFDIINNDSK